MPQTPIESLVLVYLATCAEGRRTRAAVKHELGHWLDAPDDRAVEALMAAQLIATEGRSRLTLTPSGKAQTAKVLGLETLSSKLRWGQVKRTLLLGRALGLTGDTSRLGQPEVLVGTLAARQHKLDVPVGTTANRVRDLLVCRTLGMEPPKVLTLEAIRRHVLGGKAESEKLLKGEAAKAVGARSLATAELQRATIRKWLLSPPANDLKSFAGHVLQIASRLPHRFGEDRVFISHVLRELQGASFSEAGTQQLKQRLIEANRQRLLTLARADLVSLMDPADLAASVTTDGAAEYHFVVTPA